MAKCWQNSKNCSRFLSIQKFKCMCKINLFESSLYIAISSTLLNTLIMNHINVKKMNKKEFQVISITVFKNNCLLCKSSSKVQTDGKYTQHIFRLLKKILHSIIQLFWTHSFIHLQYTSRELFLNPSKSFSLCSRNFQNVKSRLIGLEFYNLTATQILREIKF